MFFLSYIFAFLYYWYEQFMCSHCQCTFCKFSMGKKKNWFMLLFKLNTSGKKALSTIFPFHNCYPYSHYTRRCTSFTPADIVNLESPCYSVTKKLLNVTNVLSQENTTIKYTSQCIIYKQKMQIKQEIHVNAQNRRSQKENCTSAVSFRCAIHCNEIKGLIPV